MRRLRYAVIPTHDRPRDYAEAHAAIAAQVDEVITVSHGAPYALEPLVAFEPAVPNISTMWNLGLRTAEDLAEGRPYDVAVLNDDTIVPPDWFWRVTCVMRVQGAAAGCVRRAHDPRMTGYAFILDGTKRLYADTRLEWWYGDDDLQRQAERAGGVAYADGADVEHRHPNSTTVGRLASIAAEDRARFHAKWGY